MRVVPLLRFVGFEPIRQSLIGNVEGSTDARIRLNGYLHPLAAPSGKEKTFRSTTTAVAKRHLPRFEAGSYCGGAGCGEPPRPNQPVA